jgi:hypothetical protein
MRNLSKNQSTKNRDEKRDPEMHQSKKGKNGFFGMKAHIGVDAQSGLTHTLVTTAGDVSDFTQTHNLLYGRPPFARYFSACSDEESCSSISGLVRGNAAGPDEIR